MITAIERATGAARRDAVPLTLPTFLGIGAGRSGTTSLAEALRRHPDVWMHPFKEVDFFSRDEYGRLPLGFIPAKDALVPRTLEDYARLFAGGATYSVRGEFSVSYLDAEVAPRIAAALPDVRLIAILRHPVDQARSRAEVQLGHPPSELELDALLESPESIDGHQPLVERGQYHRHLEPYFHAFPRRQIFVRTFEQLTGISRKQVMMDLQRFLGVQPVDLDLPHWNRSGTNLGVPQGAKVLAKRMLPDNAVRWLSDFLHRQRELQAPLPRADVGLSAEYRAAALSKWYPDLVPGLERLGIDVSAWKVFTTN